MPTIWTTATTQEAVLTPATAGATPERTQAQTLPKTADNSVEPLPESTRPRKDGPGGN